MQGEVGTSGSRAMGWEDGEYFWILRGKRWGKTDKIRMTEARAPQTNKGALGGEALGRRHQIA